MNEKIYLKIFSEFKGVESDLIPLMIRIQEQEGYISRESVRRVSRFLRISENQIYGVATFYPKFRFTAPGKKSIKVCMGTACYVRGADQVVSAIGEALDIGEGEVTEDRKFSLNLVRCLGSCGLAPAMMIDEEVYGRLTPTEVKEILAKY